MAITGKDLIDMGFPPGPEFGRALRHINAEGLTGDALVAYVAFAKPAPIEVQPLLAEPAPFHRNIEAETEDEVANVDAVMRSMDRLMHTPTLVEGAVMPDACPAGPEGTIPVGGVAVARNAIHPGMHSADICCSVMLTEFDDADPAAVMDAVHAATHFGPGGRPSGARSYTLPAALRDEMASNPFLANEKAMLMAETHLGTQGDGNHFAYVGRSEATGKVCLVTHHGSRGLGAVLYKLGMTRAEEHRRDHAPDVLRQNAWIPADTDEGEAYWAALQLVRAWTKLNHTVIHDATVAAAGDARDRFWNEHNFVFRKGDLFYHAKGATPVDDSFLPDTDGRQIVPLNMGAPIQIVRGDTRGSNLGFAPHGAGRNLSRTAHIRRQEGRTEAEIFAEETAGLDVRFYTGNVDVSELPSAYKPAATVAAQMRQFDLADVVDQITPYGSIMAGDWERDAPWKKKRAAKKAAQARRAGNG
ncbi:MAG: RtcB family protein [Pseudomonadota bacterium]